MDIHFKPLDEENKWAQELLNFTILLKLVSTIKRFIQQISLALALNLAAEIKVEVKIESSNVKFLSKIETN